MGCRRACSPRGRGILTSSARCLPLSHAPAGRERAVCVRGRRQVSPQGTAGVVCPSVTGAPAPEGRTAGAPVALPKDGGQARASSRPLPQRVARALYPLAPRQPSGHGTAGVVAVDAARWRGAVWRRDHWEEPLSPGHAAGLLPQGVRQGGGHGRLSRRRSAVYHGVSAARQAPAGAALRAEATVDASGAAGVQGWRRARAWHDGDRAGRGTGARLGLTIACRRPPIASARSSLRPLVAPEAWR